MKQLFLICSVIALAFTSCYSYSPPPSRFLDVEKHNEMLKKWKELNIKNYSFTYSCKRFYTYPVFEIVGHVTVKNGVGEVIFDIKGHGDEINPKSYTFSYYRMTNIEDVFEHILDKNYENRRELGRKKLDGVWYQNNSSSPLQYDGKYFFPRYISYKVQYPYYKRPNSWEHVVGKSSGPSDTFRITDFAILE